MTMIMRLERTSEEVKTRARHVIICDNYPEKHRCRKALPIFSRTSAAKTDAPAPLGCVTLSGAGQPKFLWAVSNEIVELKLTNLTPIVVAYHCQTP